MKTYCLLILLLAPALSGCESGSAPAPTPDSAITEIDAFISQQKIDKTQPGWKTSLPQPPKLTFDPKRKYYWILQTGKGRLKVELMPANAPMHVSSTIYLARLGFYDGLKFHRIIPGFMAQGGDPIGTGKGNPGYQYSGEFIDKSLKHSLPGLLSMANVGPGTDTDGSQFFLTFVPTPWLDNLHTIFGKLVEGFQALTFIQNAGSKDGTPTEEILINKSFIETR
ncbi:MAG TPA: peptidylprolyl isomerase [Planctomycetes bacterium]|nr:peptidylprolyl isomerase [Planctomycetota bacterium]